MFQVGDLVVYQTEGVCRVAEITTLDWIKDGKDRLYYILSSLKNPASRIYCPVDNDKAAIRKVMTKEEAVELLDAIPQYELLWIENEKQREEIYKGAMRSASSKELVRVIKTLYQRRKVRVELGKKMTSTDERYFKAAKTLLYEELAVALDQKEDEMEQYIVTYLSK